MKAAFSFLSVVLAAFLAWNHAHPAFVALACTSAVSLVYGRLEKYPRVHAFFTILAGMGIDVPKIADGVTRLLEGEVPVAAVETVAEKLVPAIEPQISNALLETMKARVALEKTK